MKSLIKKLLLDNWQRKILALILAIITWAFVNHSLTVTKTVSDIPVKVINLTKEKAIKGMQNDGTLAESTSLTLTGNKNLIDRITKNDLVVVVDLKDKKEDFKTVITKSNLISKNPNVNIERSIKKVAAQDLAINLSKFVKEKIPLLITQPIGEPPKGYQFLDVWPYRLWITVSGPEELVKNLKAKGLKLTFNLNDVSEKELDSIDAANKRGRRDVVSFFVPTSWKRINIPSISSSAMEIDDPNAKALRIDFIKKDFIAMNSRIPVSLFFPVKYSDKLNPNNITLANNDFIKKINGINMITIPLYAKGVSELFVDVLKEKMQIVILVQPKEEEEFLGWNIQAVLPLELEKMFVTKVLSDETDDQARELQPQITEEHVKVRFRTYMNKFRLWLSSKEKLNLKITLENDQVVVIPENNQ